MPRISPTSRDHPNATIFDVRTMLNRLLQHYPSFFPQSVTLAMQQNAANDIASNWKVCLVIIQSSIGFRAWLSLNREWRNAKVISTLRHLYKSGFLPDDSNETQNLVASFLRIEQIQENTLAIRELYAHKLLTPTELTYEFLSALFLYPNPNTLVWSVISLKQNNKLTPAVKAFLLLGLPKSPGLKRPLLPILVEVILKERLERVLHREHLAEGIDSLCRSNQPVLWMAAAKTIYAHKQFFQNFINHPDPFYLYSVLCWLDSYRTHIGDDDTLYRLLHRLEIDTYVNATYAIECTSLNTVSDIMLLIESNPGLKRLEILALFIKIVDINFPETKRLIFLKCLKKMWSPYLLPLVKHNANIHLLLTHLGPSTELALDILAKCTGRIMKQTVFELFLTFQDKLFNADQKQLWTNIAKEKLNQAWFSKLQTKLQQEQDIQAYLTETVGHESHQPPPELINLEHSSSDDSDAYSRYW